MSPGGAKHLLIHFGQLGDAVMALPAALALRQAHPEAALTVLASRGGDAIFRLAGFDPVWAADRAAWKRSPIRAAGGIPLLLARLRHARFDLSVDLHSFKETNLLAWAAGIPQRVAMLRPTRSWPRFITHPPPPDDPDARLLDRYCRVLEPLGINVTDRVPRLTPPPEAAACAADLLAPSAAAPILGICPGAGHPGRRWPAANFAALAHEFQQQVPARIAVFLGPEENEAALRPLLALSGVEPLRGLSIPQLAAALALCRVVVANPTGPSHIAAAVAARVVTLGEIPAFDPVPVPPGAVFPVRARREVADIEVPAALAAVLQLWNLFHFSV
ncbi:MAG TPA: glycosyltransferase family 9 protein [Terriglobales bacterium]|nr:glycosyltransferase family 9 protein [Terriglobales bacterium]